MLVFELPIRGMGIPLLQLMHSKSPKPRGPKLTDDIEIPNTKVSETVLVLSTPVRYTAFNVKPQKGIPRHGQANRKRQN